MKKISFYKISTVLMLSALTFGCAHKLDNKSNSFSYDDQDSWEFQSGKMQSPINIASANVKRMKAGGDIRIKYDNRVIDQVDNSHTIQVNAKGLAQINQRLFALTQFHFHSPSEHTLNNKYYPLEVHFVHQSEDGRLAVIGVFFKEGKANSAFEQILKNIKKGETNKTPGTINISQLMPKNKSYYHYLGSLTTPPLLENVEWYVMNNHIEVSASQIARFKEYYDGNNRKPQSMNDRPLLYRHTN